MQLGPEGEEELVSLFTDDAVYIEPFSGRRHEGKDAIRTFLASARAAAPPDLRIAIEHVRTDEDRVEATWRCESPVFTKPSRGLDRFTIRDGRIARLETTLLEPPELA